MMASNKDLKDEAEALGAKLGVAVDTNGLNHTKLEELVAGLREQASAGAPPTSATTEGEPKAENDEGEPPTGKPDIVYTVVRGKVITTLRGPAGAGDRISARDLHGGEAALKQLVTLGAVKAS